MADEHIKDAFCHGDRDREPDPGVSAERSNDDTVDATTSPLKFASAPPELPGLMEASVWIKGSSFLPGSLRPKPLTMPKMAVCPRPNGFPMATT